MMRGLARVNLGGEGEVPGVLNVQGPWIRDSTWACARDGRSLAALQMDGHVLVIADNRRLPFGNDSIDEIITNSVPIDFVTGLGPGIQSSEVLRIRRPGCVWVDDGVVRVVKP